MEMKRPDYRPFAMGGSDDLEVQQSCAQLEASLNADRSSGESCINAISSFTYLFSPSICGCEGFTPQDPCAFCSGRGVNRDAQVLGENFTCGEKFDFIQHVSPVFCSNPDINPNELEGVCCTDILESNSNSAASVGTRRFFPALASLLVGLPFA